MSLYIPQNNEENAEEKQKIVNNEEGYIRKNVVLTALIVLIVLNLACIGYAMPDTSLTVAVNDEIIQVKEFQGTVEEFMQFIGQPLDAADAVTPDRDALLSQGAVINVIKAVPLKLTDGGVTSEIKTVQNTVGDLFKEQNIKINKTDKVNVAMTDSIIADMEINIIRVKIIQVTKKEKIDYKTVEEETKSLYAGETIITQEGKIGIKEVTYSVTSENGKEVSREEISSVVKEEPQDEIILVGTKEKETKVSRSDNKQPGENSSNSGSNEGSNNDSNNDSINGDSIAYTLTMEATAYTHTGNSTASGVYPSVGTIAVDPSVIPLGTRLYVEGYGYGIAQDTGGAIVGNRIDVFFDTEQECINWGRRTVTVHILQ